MSEARPQVTLDPFDILLLVVVCISGASLLLFVAGHFSPLSGLGVGTLFASVLVLLCRIRLARGIPELSPWMFVILVVATIYRADSYFTLLGGSDEGIYLSMAASFERTGRPEVVDSFRARLNPEEKAYFDRTNLGAATVAVPGKYEGNRFPGVDVKSRERSEYVFQFYPLHSLWMSISGLLFGARHCTLSLLFFSLLSLCSIYFLAVGASGGSRLAGLGAALLLAVNPLHALFSKFPTSEIVVLAFSSAAFCMLLKFHKSAEDSPERPWYLAISAGAMGCLFFTHLRGFLYLPFFYLLFLAAVIRLDARRTRCQFFAYAGSILVLFALALAYGNVHDYPYYATVFGVYLGLDGQGATSRLWVAGIGAIGTAVLATTLRRPLRPLLDRAGAALPVVFLMVLGVAVVSAAAFGFTSYLEHVGYEGLSGGGWKSVRFSTLSFLTYYVSPPGLLLLAGFAVAASTRRPAPYHWLMVFLILMWTATLVTYPGLPDFYRARYLLPEVVPCFLMLVALTLQWLWERGPAWRRLAMLTGVGTALFFLYFTTLQMKAKIKDAGDMHFDRVANVVQPEDVLFVKMGNPLGGFVSTPLANYFGLTVVATDDLRSALAKFARVLAPEEVPGVYLLSDERESDPLLQQVDAFKFSVTTFEADIVPSVPTRWATQILRLYRVQRDKFPSP